jgi:hypothetical protein
MSVLAPPPQDDLELDLLIREARARQRRRRLIGAAVVALVAATGLSLWAAIPGLGGGSAGPSGGAEGATSQSLGAGRVQVMKIGTSGGVTWAINNRGMWLTTNGGRTWRLSAPTQLLHLGGVNERVGQVTFVDRQHGWLFAPVINSFSAPLARSGFFRTSDGGRTWQRLLPNDCCGNFSFVNRRLGFRVGYRGHLYETRNGGATWTLTPGPKLRRQPDLPRRSPRRLVPRRRTAVDGGRRAALEGCPDLGAAGGGRQQERRRRGGTRRRSARPHGGTRLRGEDVPRPLAHAPLLQR